MANPAVLISIVIPVKNGLKTIGSCLESIVNQTLFHLSEIIIIDSGSTDGTLEIIKNFPVRLYQISPDDFNHGTTRNYGVNLANGEFVLMTVQDAVLEDQLVIENALKHFIRPDVQAVAGRQAVPHHLNKNPHQWYRPVSKPQIEYFHFVAPSQFDNLPPSQKRWACGIDDVIAFYRKKALLTLPFKTTSFGEDFIWANEAYHAGFGVIIDPSIKVWHYHSQSYTYAYKISIICAYNEWKILGLLPYSSFNLNDIIIIVYRNIKFKAHPKWIKYNIVIHYAINKAKKTMDKAIKQSDLVANDLYNLHVAIVPQGKP